MKNLPITTLLICLYFPGFGIIRPPQDTLHQQRMKVIQQVLDAVEQNSSTTDSVFSKLFDQERGAPAADNEAYQEWLNFFLPHWIDTLSEKDIKELSILDKRSLCHQYFFQHLKERLKTVDPKDIKIFPYATVEDPESFDRGYNIYEEDVKNTYVITYPYLGGKRVEYVLFSDSSKIRSMAYTIESTGQVMGYVMYF